MNNRFTITGFIVLVMVQVIIFLYFFSTITISTRSVDKITGHISYIMRNLANRTSHPSFANNHEMRMGRTLIQTKFW